jgi:hypothetical protein
VLAPWAAASAALRFETEGAWKARPRRSISKELRLALIYPEGAAV